jgi:hypothetical protein
MRIAVFAAIFLVSACASNSLSLAPPAGVDFSGHWKLNEAESDDPQHLLQTANAQASAATGDTGSAGGRGGRGGRGGANGYGGIPAPAIPSIGALGDGLSWPGKIVDIKQVAGVVAFTSEGRNQVCQPASADKKPRSAAMPARREAPPPLCGWSDKTLIVKSNDPDDDRPPFEQRFSVSQDGSRLVEVVGFKGGRSNGFTMSRTWDRTQQ